MCVLCVCTILNSLYKCITILPTIINIPSLVRNLKNLSSDQLDIDQSRKIPYAQTVAVTFALCRYPSRRRTNETVTSASFHHNLIATQIPIVLRSMCRPLVPTSRDTGCPFRVSSIQQISLFNLVANIFQENPIANFRNYTILKMHYTYYSKDFEILLAP